MDAAHPGGLGGTFGGNPVSCAAAVAVFDQIERLHLLGEAQRIEKTLTAGLAALQKKYPLIGDIRGRGAMIAIELVVPGTKKPDAAAVKHVVDHGFQNGLLLLNAGTNYNVLRFLPNVRMTDELITDALGVLDEALASYTK
jgi:4-aminobutyrate aminotransferase/(S)-3-amino-2-methylpropionate transaminase